LSRRVPPINGNWPDRAMERSARRYPAGVPIVIVVSVVRTLRRGSSAGPQTSPTQLGLRAVKRAMLVIEVHRHPAVITILDGRGIDGISHVAR
jgi:hypothetical protein